MSTVPARADVSIESTWNHESVFPSFDAWRDEYQATAAALSEIEPYQGTLSQEPDRLLEWFELHATVFRRIYKLYMYPVMWQACDSTNEEIKGMVGQAQGLFGHFMSSASFAEPELLAMDETDLQNSLKLDALSSISTILTTFCARSGMSFPAK